MQGHTFTCERCALPTELTAHTDSVQIEPKECTILEGILLASY